MTHKSHVLPKEATTYELALPERDTEALAYRWLYASVRAAILEGRLRAGAQLPATRELAVQYGLSCGTALSNGMPHSPNPPAMIVAPSWMS